MREGATTTTDSATRRVPGAARRGLPSPQVVAPPERIDLSFAFWVARQIRRRRISQRELARQAGIDHSTISRILLGERAPSWGTVQRIAMVVGFPPPNVLFSRVGGESSRTRRRTEARRASGG